MESKARSPSVEYWENRAALRMDEYLFDSNEALRRVNAAITRGEADIRGAIQRIYRAFGKRYGVTEEEARGILNKPIGKQEYDRLVEQIRTMPDGSDKKALMMRADTSSAAYRISRQEALWMEVKIQGAKIASIAEKAFAQSFADVIKSAYIHAVYDVQRGIGIGFSFGGINTGAIKELLRTPWSGEAYSSRIWKNADKLVETLEDVLVPQFMGTHSMQQSISAVAERMSVARSDAVRIVRTETNYFANQAELAADKEIGIKEYRFVATLDMKTSRQCQEKDGQVFPISEAKAGKNYPPMHPHCRSVTIGAYGKALLEKWARASRDPITGETVYVPASMKYEDWLKLQKEHYGEERMWTAEKMAQNEKADRSQYERYAIVLKDELKSRNIGTFKDFQVFKYTDFGAYEKLKDEYALNR